jgi:MFS family permease
MNSLGGGGEQEPYLVNAANALTFCMMILSCYFSSAVTRYTGIKGVLILGTLGFAPYAAGLYCNNRFGTHWAVLIGAAVCGICAGFLWTAEAAIALAYPEPYNQGRFLGFWLSFRLGGQVVGGAINLSLNVHNTGTGKVSYNVFLVFIALQCCAPFCGLLLTQPWNVERTDGRRVHLKITDSPVAELRATGRLLLNRKFLLIIPLIAQTVYTEAVTFTFQASMLHL